MLNDDAHKGKERETQESRRLDLIDYLVFGASYDLGKAYSVVRLCSKNYYCFPLLAIMLLGVIIAFSLLWPDLASSISYLFFIPLLIATFIIVTWFITGGYSKYRMPFYKLPAKVRYEDSFVINLRNVDINFRPLEHAISEYEVPNSLKSMLRTGAKNLEAHFVMATGRENRPLITLRKLRFNGGSLEIDWGVASFYDMWRTHYFADVILARRVSRSSESIKWACDVLYERNAKEKCEKLVTLRNVLSAYLNWYFNSRLQQPCFEKSRLSLMQDKEEYAFMYTYATSAGDKSSKAAIAFPEILPNGLGVTGVVILQEKSGEKKIALLQLREDNALDPSKLQWSFAGIIGAFDDFLERKSLLADFSNHFSLDDFMWEELYDEVLRPLDIPKHTNYKVQALGLIINADKLYQPELIVSVRIPLEKSELTKITKTIQHWKQADAKSNLRYLNLNNQNDIKEFEQWISTNKPHKMRYIFPIIWALAKIELEV